ncbi:MAG TPA: HAD-IA family hydrolase [Bradyrhizobium sp.]|jgi:FMN phosphatase YigB (HAD superfamily)|nr:HAD-IA family hydrolase [Bradyrhizobium sp.]
MTLAHLSPARLSPGDADALLFDLGRVVFNIDFPKALACWADHAGCDTAEIAARFVHDESYRHHEVGTISDEAYFESLRRALRIGIADHQFLEGWNSIFAGEMEGISPLLKRAAQHLPLYVYSNTNRAHVAYFTKIHAETLKPFRELYYSSTIGHRKPDAAGFDHVVGAIGVPASRIVFFDDLAENVEAARARGLKAVHVRSSRDVAEALTALGI